MTVLGAKAAEWADSGRLQQLLAALNASSTPRTASDILTAIANLPPSAAFRPLAFCDAFTASGAATPGGTGAIFARDFQFALALVFQELQSTSVRVPATQVGGMASQA